jgi:TonB family protein
MYASPARSTLISGALHGAVITLALLTSGVPTPLVKNAAHIAFLVPADLVKYRVAVPQRDNPGGGGGMRAKTAASLGNLPKLSHKQFIAPIVKTENDHPVLILEPSIIADASITVAHIDLAQFGDPHGVPGPPSAGTGKGGGIGSGDGTGVGSGDGAGAGPGHGSGISGGLRGALTEPVLLYKVDPEYSEEARKAKLQGVVMVRAVIDAHGVAQNIAVAQGLGFGLDERAIAAVQKWKFRAAMRDGKPVATAAMIQLTFRLL